MAEYAALAVSRFPGIVRLFWNAFLPEIVSQKADGGVVVAGKRGQELGASGQACFIRKSLEETGGTSIAVTRVKSLDDASAGQKGAIAASTGRQFNDGQLCCREGRICSLRESSQGDGSLTIVG